ncbi:MAG: hypothetical protein JW779_03240 [Candidatus Thorarchaeota archaeon]|nr:hypothetical protein [Candidatus Thorarchaeota archaeon]
MKISSRVIIFLTMILLIAPSGLNKAIPRPNQSDTMIVFETCNQNPVFTHSSEEPVLYDGFDEFPGYNQSLWNFESYGEGCVSWLVGDQFEMNASRHSYRTLSSIQTFEVGHEAVIRMKLQEEEAVVCVGWTNHTAITEWNYLFGGDSILLQGALSTVLLERVVTEYSQRTSRMLSGLDPSVFHDYRIVWNSSVIIAYVDDVRLGAIGDTMPSGPFHFKIAITEFRNVTTQGGVIIDSVTIREHHSMISEFSPFISLGSPGNSTINLGSDVIDIIPVGHDGLLYWSWDGALNSSSESPYDIRLPLVSGQHILDVYCRDGYGYDNWARERFVFITMGDPPELNAAWMSTPPTIDGIFLENEWPEISLIMLNLVRTDGLIIDVNVMIGSDERFIYFGIDSPVASGHDSRAALIIDETFDGVYKGHNGTPTRAIWYIKGSPDAWKGYDEIQVLNQSAQGVISNFKLTPIPSGFLSDSSVTSTGVHYEFRVPMEEFNAVPGTSLGISVMLYPSGMGVHNLFYPLTYPWENASRLAILHLATTLDISVLIVGSSLGIGFIALVTYFGWRRRVSGISTYIETEDSMRIVELIKSYDQITLERLSRMIGTSENELRNRIGELQSQNAIDVKISDNGTIKRR